MQQTHFRVAVEGDYWVVQDATSGTLLSRHLTESQALDRARTLARQANPSQITIQRPDGDHTEFWNDGKA
jgi:hypothetical protein